MSATTRRLFDHDETTGMTEWFTYDPHSGGFVIETTQDVSALLEVNRALYNASDTRAKYDNLTRIASIPNVVLMDLAKQGIVTPAGRILDDKKYRAWLNDPANVYFRVRPGRV